jgi:hypothetical protein
LICEVPGRDIFAIERKIAPLLALASFGNSARFIKSRNGLGVPEFLLEYKVIWKFLGSEIFATEEKIGLSGYEAVSAARVELESRTHEATVFPLAVSERALEWKFYN